VILLAGRQANALETANDVTVSPSADALFPGTNLYDSKPGTVFKFGSLTASPTITVDLDMIEDTGGFETVSGFPVGWTTAVSGTGAVTQESDLANVQFGDYSALLETPAGAGVASLYRDVVVRAGSTVLVEAWLKTDATALAEAAIRDQKTGMYWTGTAWQSAATTWATHSGSGPFSRYVSAVEVEDVTTVGGAVTTLRFQFSNATTTSEAWVDGVTICPAISFCSIHGHNIDPRSAPVLRSSIDNFVVDDTSRGTLTPAQPAFYLDLGSVISSASAAIPRYWRLAFADTNSAASGAIYIGELVLGEGVTYRSGALPLQANYSAQQVRVPRRFGAPAVFGMGDHELRSFPLTLRTETVAERDALFDEWRRTIQGYACVVVAHGADGHTDVLFCLAGDAMPTSWATKIFAALSVEFEELPHPLITG
jgi:hypothetical protein